MRSRSEIKDPEKKWSTMAGKSQTWTGPGETPCANWSDPRNWIDSDGIHRIPGVEEDVKFGDSATEAEPSDTTRESTRSEDETTFIPE